MKNKILLIASAIMILSAEAFTQNTVTSVTPDDIIELKSSSGLSRKAATLSSFHKIVGNMTPSITGTCTSSVSGNYRFAVNTNKFIVDVVASSGNVTKTIAGTYTENTTGDWIQNINTNKYIKSITASNGNVVETIAGTKTSTANIQNINSKGDFTKGWLYLDQSTAQLGWKLTGGAQLDLADNFGSLKINTGGGASIFVDDNTAGWDVLSDGRIGISPASAMLKTSSTFSLTVPDGIKLVGNSQINALADLVVTSSGTYSVNATELHTIASPSVSITGTNLTVTNITEQRGQEYFAIATLTDGANIDWNLNTQQVAKVTLAGNRTLNAPTNIKAGGIYTIFVIQDATGSRTVTWNSVFKWPAGTAPTLTITANAVDILHFISHDGTNLYQVAKSLDVR